MKDATHGDARIARQGVPIRGGLAYLITLVIPVAGERALHVDFGLQRALIPISRIFEAIINFIQ